MLIAAAATLVAALGASPALAQQEPAGTNAPAPAATPETGAAPAPALPQPMVTSAAPGTYSAPRWLPLRRDLPGTEVTVGCTLDSHGSQFGYECGGHHDRWAIDFLADTGTPVFAAGAGFATDISGKPGGSGFGNVVSIDHGFGVTTLYAHLSEAFIPPEGRWVDETTLLGKVGQTGSASAPHLHFEEFGNPGGNNSNNPMSIDPGPLYACRGDLLVAFPQVAGFDSWAGLSWGSFTVASDGHDCATDAAAAKTDATAGADPAEAGPVDTAADPDADQPWSDVIAPVLDLIAGTGKRIDLPD
ncbi:M23 family metallopeptidase [Aquihabitans daechungensis]|uniref:M23 family metallopeptidase n=1 Tax=Aquihabitans daechungensis TaxID=1052257 RepID=UPI003B9DD65B